MSRINNTVYDRAGTHALTLARAEAAGAGMFLSLLRHCIRCNRNVHPKGGTLKPYFVCAECRGKTQ